MNCPLCESKNYMIKLSLKCGGFDNSPLYRNLVIANCNDCGHIFNLLNEKEIEGLMEYYRGEYSQCNINSPNKSGDIPGSINKDSLNRYSELLKVIEKDLNENSKVLDIGCAMGGFLNFIKPYTKNLYGIEPSIHFVEKAKEETGINNIVCGTINNIWYGIKTFDVIIADQVLEHVVDINSFFKEVNRILKDDGIFCISVPNAMEYEKYNFFDFYFFLMREHIHHFSKNNLELLANKWGFELIDTKYTYPNLVSKEWILPNLTLKFKKTGIKNIKIECDADLYFSISKYINDSFDKLRDKKELIKKYMNFNNINIYGMSREFHYIYNNTDLRKLNLILFDDTKTKQEMTIDGNKIFSSKYLNNFYPTIITAFAHINTLKKIII